MFFFIVIVSHRYLFSLYKQAFLLVKGTHIVYQIHLIFLIKQGEVPWHPMTTQQYWLLLKERWTPEISLNNLTLLQTGSINLICYEQIKIKIVFLSPS